MGRNAGDVPVSLRRSCSLRIAGHHARARRDHNGCSSCTCRDGGVHIVAVVRTVSSEGRDRIAVPVEQGIDLPAVIVIVPGQLGSDDLASVGVCGEMQLPPQPTRPGAMPLTTTQSPGPHRRWPVLSTADARVVLSGGAPACW